MTAQFRKGRINLLAMAFALAVGALLALTWSRHEARTDATVSESRPVSAPEAFTASSDAAATTSAAPAAPASPRPDVLTEATPTPAEQARREEEVRRAASALDRAHAKEPLEPAWAAASERSLADFAEEVRAHPEIPQPLSMQTECRSSTCRIVAYFDRMGEAQDWANTYATVAGRTFGRSRVIVLPEADGRSAVRIFASGG